MSKPNDRDRVPPDVMGACVLLLQHKRLYNDPRANEAERQELVQGMKVIINTVYEAILADPDKLTTWLLQTADLMVEATLMVQELDAIYASQNPDNRTN